MPLQLPVPLGIGTMMWGTTWLDAKVNGRLLPVADATAIVARAREAGVTFFDTAEGYGGGTCEETLSAACGALGLGAAERASTLVLATKFLPTLWRWTEGAVLRALEHSNRRLGVECCPLYFLHSPVHPRGLEVWIHACGKAFRAGKLRALGLSNCDAAQIRRAVAVAKQYDMPIVANQIMFNLMVFRSPQLQATIAECEAHGITVVAYSPIGQGLLCNDLTAEKAKGIRLSRMTRLSFDDLRPLREVLAATASSHGATMAQVSIAWVVAKGAVPLVGTRTLAQLEDTLGAVKLQLTAAEVEQLDLVALGRHTFEKPKWRRSLFVVFISCLMTAYKVSRLFK